MPTLSHSIANKSPNFSKIGQHLQQLQPVAVADVDRHSKFSKVTEKHKCPLWAHAWLTVKWASARVARLQHI